MKQAYEIFRRLEFYERELTSATDGGDILLLQRSIHELLWVLQMGGRDERTAR